MPDDDLDQRLPDPHRPTDVAYALARGVVGMIPIGGSLLSEVFGLILTDPMQRRKDQWMEMVHERVSGLESAGISIEDLQRNPAFISTLIRASHDAVRTAQREKLDALRNAVTNAALPGAPEESEQQIFLNLIERFTEWHLRILRWASAPAPRNESTLHETATSLSQQLERHIPQLRGRREFYDIVWRDLHGGHLVGPNNLQTMMSYHGATQDQRTDFGRAFGKFVEEPDMVDMGVS